MIAAVSAWTAFVVLDRPAVSTAAAGLPSDFVGIVSEDAYAGASAYRGNAHTAQRQSGIGLLRQTFTWSNIEPRRGEFDFSATDGFVASAARQRFAVLPVLFGPPAWASSRPTSGGRRGTYPPRRPADMGRFATALVGRYGPAGTFWSAHPDLPRIPIRSWQVWNEPNLEVYWPTGPSPQAYARLLKTVGRAIHAADRGAEVVTAGLPKSRLGMSPEQFVRGLYWARAKSAFDTVAINPYAQTASGVVAILRRVRRVMNAAGDPRAGIRATELGWSDTGPRGAFRLGPAGQARAIGSTIRALARERHRLSLRGFVYYGWRDLPVYAGGKDFWGLHTGLLDIRGDAKPALDAFAAAVHAIR